MLVFITTFEMPKQINSKRNKPLNAYSNRIGYFYAYSVPNNSS